MKEEIYEYLWSLGILEKRRDNAVGVLPLKVDYYGNYSTRRDAIIDSIRGGDRLKALFSDEEWTLLRGMITRMDREVKLSNLLEKK